MIPRPHLTKSCGTTPDDVRAAHARLHTRIRYVIAAIGLRQGSAGRDEFAVWMLLALEHAANAADADSRALWHQWPVRPTADACDVWLRRQGRRRGR